MASKGISFKQLVVKYIFTNSILLVAQDHSTTGLAMMDSRVNFRPILHYYTFIASTRMIEKLKHERRTFWNKNHNFILPVHRIYSLEFVYNGITQQTVKERLEVDYWIEGNRYRSIDFHYRGQVACIKFVDFEEEETVVVQGEKWEKLDVIGCEIEFFEKGSICVRLRRNWQLVYQDYFSTTLVKCNLYLHTRYENCIDK